MSEGRQGPRPGQLLDTTRVELEQAWKDREAEAAALFAAGHVSMALALRVYSLEIRLKWHICRHLRLDYLPRAYKTHDLPDIIIFTGLIAELDDSANEPLLTNWDALAAFSKLRLNEDRYQAGVSLDPDVFHELSAALDDPTDGVLSWLSRHP